MTFLFDRCVPGNLPQALKKLRSPIQPVLHRDYFPGPTDDDVWLTEVGLNGWFVVTQDYKWHLEAAQIAAIKTYKLGCFYLWGASAPTWEIARTFFRAFDGIQRVIQETPRPFIYRIDRNGRLKLQPLP